MSDKELSVRIILIVLYGISQLVTCTIRLFYDQIAQF